MKKYARLTVEQYLKYVKDNLNREIHELHRHHTWLPNYNTWKKAKDKRQVMVAMENYHVKTMGWADIAQNATLDPEGYIWVCRDLNRTPVSIKGRNTGAWALEMIGDFDEGKDEMTKEQHEAMVRVFHGMQEITGAIIVDHNEHSSKTCPGTALKKEDLLMEIEALKNSPKPEEDKVEKEQWKYEGIKYLEKEQILNDPEMWKKQINDPMPVWAVTLIIKRVYKKLRE